MLAQNFKTPAELDISDAEFDALVKVLGMLERGEIGPQNFNMGSFLTQTDCGTVGCLCGWAHHVSGGLAFPEIGNNIISANQSLVARMSGAASELFCTTEDDVEYNDWQRIMWTATPASAAIALRSYLTHGEARWDEALATSSD